MPHMLCRSLSVLFFVLFFQTLQADLGKLCDSVELDRTLLNQVLLSRVVKLS